MNTNKQTHGIDQYQDFCKTTAIYPDANTGNDSELMYLALGLTGEAGEVANDIKKIYRDNLNDEETTKAAKSIAKELSDTLWYIARTADVLGYSMSELISINMSKLTDRKNRNVLGGSGDLR